MKFSFCSIAFRHSARIEEIIRKISACGYDALEIWEGHLYIWQDKLDGKDLSHIPAVRELLDNHKLKCSMVSSYFAFTEGQKRWDDSFEMAKIYISIAEMLGARLVRAFTGGTGSAEATPEQWAMCVKAFKALCPVAGEKNIKFALETHPKNLTDTVWGCLRLIEEVGSEALAVNFQPGSFPDCDPAELYDRFWGRVVNLHLSSFSDNDGFLRALRERDYRGYAAIEFGRQPLWKFAETEGRYVRSLTAIS